MSVNDKSPKAKLRNAAETAVSVLIMGALLAATFLSIGGAHILQDAFPSLKVGGHAGISQLWNATNTFSDDATEVAVAAAPLGAAVGAVLHIGGNTKRGLGMMVGAGGALLLVGMAKGIIA